jgi:5-carboxymethyl-2-hydroxymuconate isomerase
MPHLTLEYTANLSALDPARALEQLNQTLANCGHFNEADIKSRALKLEVFRVGTAPTPRAFAHAKLSLMPGRSPEVKRQIAEALLAGLQTVAVAASGTELQLCVELFEIDKAVYAKESRLVP